MKTWLYRIFVILGLIAFALVVWFAGPLIGFGDARPLSGFWTRIIIIVAAFALAGGIYGFRYWRRRKAEKALEEAIVEPRENDSDARILGERMGEALETLKRSSGKRAFLYELPWYVIIGPPGAGKTTALVNSGLKFPLAGSDGGAAVAGVGGTRYCDWWFTEDAVLIDTAGRYTTHDSDTESDRKSWRSFLSLLKTNRSKQPINGVILAISLEDMMKLDGQELAAHAGAIRKRLQELHEELKVDFPVYALFTKADLIAGFSEYFGNFTESRRRKVWGATFQTEDRRKNMVSEAPGEFDALVRRLTEEMTDRLHEEPDAISRIAIFGFPAQFATLKESISDFLSKIFEPTRYQSNANLRGFYFSSGTQEGTPIDQVLGAMDRSFGDQFGARQMSGTGRSYFLHDLLKKVIFAEAGWVSLNVGAVRRANIVRYGSMAAVALVSVFALSAWGWSYASNKSLIAETDKAVNQYSVNADAFLKSDTVSDVDLQPVLGALDSLRNMPVGFSTQDAPTPMGEKFGLSQRERLIASSKAAYRQALERMLRSRLILRLERQIEDNMSNPIVVYEALKVYLMLGGKAPRVDDELIVDWMRQDWSRNLYPGPNNRDVRDALEGHLRAMLDLDFAKRPSFELNKPLIESAQRALARMDMDEQAYTLIQSDARSAPIQDFSIVARGGPDTADVFETVDGSDIDEVVVPGLYTYAGFHEYFLTQLAAVAEKLESEQWVMGEYGEQEAVEEQFSRLGPTLLDRYAKDFVEQWTGVLDNLRFKTLSADKPEYFTLSAAAAPTSPIRSLFEAIAEETRLTADHEGEDGDAVASLSDAAGSGAAGEAAGLITQRLRDRAGGLSRIGIDVALSKSQSRAGGVFGSGGSGSRRIPGASVEAQFKAYHVMMDGEPGRRPIDMLIQNFNEVYQSLVLSATNPSQRERAVANLQVQVANLRANASRLPRPLARMVNAAVDDFEGDAAGTSIAQLNQMLASTVTRQCKEVIANRYPFARRSSRDVPMSDFARLFAPNGIIDRFFAQNLASMVDMSGKVWEWKQDTRLGRELSNSSLRDFQRAADIRDAFFPQGGTMPNVNVTIGHYSLHGSVDMALLDVNGQVVRSQQAGSIPQTIQWPGSMAAGSVSVSLTPEMRGRKSSLVVNGPWAFMRLLDAGSVGSSGDTVRARFVIGGRDVAYNIQVGSLKNPFFLPALSEFECPAGL